MNRRHKLMRNIILMGGVGFTPLKMPGCILWMDANSIAGSDGDAIASWISKEGSAFDFAQGTAGKRPTLKKGANGINGHNVALFDGGDLLVYTGTISVATEGTAFAIYTTNVTGAQEIITSSDVATNDHYLALRGNYSTGSPRMASTQLEAPGVENKMSGWTVLVNGTVYLAVWQSTGAAYKFRLNGAAETFDVISGADNGNWLGDTTLRDNVVLGGIKILVGESNLLIGKLAEVILYDTALSTANIQTVERYLATKYGITLP